MVKNEMQEKEIWMKPEFEEATEMRNQGERNKHE